MFVLDIEVKSGIKNGNENFLNCSPKIVKQNQLPPNCSPRELPWKKQIVRAQGAGERGDIYFA